MMMPFVDLATQQTVIKEELKRRLSAVFKSGRYIMGDEVKEIEKTLAEYVGVKHTIACASGTDALLISLMALDIKPGDEVITTAFTYAATGEVILRLGATPVFVDINPDTYNIDYTKIEAAVTDKTKAIIPVSLYGQCADFDEINDIAKKYGLFVIEDGAQSFGATYKGKKSCSLSIIGCTSFFPTKPLGCYGDGGACFTNDDELAIIMDQIRRHGQDKRYHHVRMGLNSRLDSLQAAVLLAKMTIFDEEIKKRELIGKKYTELLSKIPGIKTPHINKYNSCVYAQYTLGTQNRQKLQTALNDAGIPTAVHYPIPLNKQPIFKNLKTNFNLLNLEYAADHVLSLPMSAYVKDNDIEKIAEIIRKTEF